MSDLLQAKIEQLKAVLSVEEGAELESLENDLAVRQLDFNDAQADLALARNKIARFLIDKERKHKLALEA